MTVFKMEIISQSVLTWLKYLELFFLRNIRNVADGEQFDLIFCSPLDSYLI